MNEFLFIQDQIFHFYSDQDISKGNFELLLDTSILAIKLIQASWLLGMKYFEEHGLIFSLG